jgi:opacity protein-like surface antigen
LLTIVAEARRDFGAAVEKFGGVSLAVPTTHDAFSLRAEFEPLRTLMVFAEASYEQDRRDGPSREEDLWSFGAGANYALTANLRLEAEFNYWVGSSNFSGDFDRSRLSIGITTQY